MNLNLIQSWIRHLLTLAGGWLLSKPGLIDAAGVEAIIGGVCAIAGLVWSLVHHKAKA